MEKIKKNSKTLYKIISVLIAVALWIYVAYQETPDGTRWITNVPITIVGADVLDQNGLYVIDTDRATVDVRLRGDRVDLSKVVVGDITARLDVSGIEAAGNTSLTCNITVNKSNIEVSRARNNSVIVTAERIVTDLFPVTIDMDGAPAVGYNVFEPAVYPAEVTVRGAESLINSIDSVSTKSVSVSKVSRSNTVNVGLNALASNGETISGVTFEPSSVEVSYTVLREKSVTLTVPQTNVPAGKRATYSPQTLKIYGSSENLSGISDVSTDTVDISMLEDGDELRLSLKLPEGIYAADGGDIVNVTFSIADVTEADAAGSPEEDE